MPYGDGSGPAGAGPRTGRAVGYCAGYNRPGAMNRAAGGRGLARGFRGGRGRGRGRGRRVAPNRQSADNLDQEIDQLEAEKEALKEELTAMENRIAELKQARDTDD